jgi:hypothetical protein
VPWNCNLPTAKVDSVACLHPSSHAGLPFSYLLVILGNCNTKTSYKRDHAWFQCLAPRVGYCEALLEYILTSVRVVLIALLDFLSEYVFPHHTMMTLANEYRYCTVYVCMMVCCLYGICLYDMCVRGDVRCRYRLTLHCKYNS